MRVIAGRYKGRRLLAPEGHGTRPILDRVKVSLFDWLGSTMASPGTLPPVAVLDVFCGPGSLGIESLSRGATHCAFVERDPAALACLRRNLAHLGVTKEEYGIIEEAAEVMRPRRPADPLGYGLVFLDPPYRLSEDLSAGSAMRWLLKRLGGDIPVRDDAPVLWRHDGRVTLPGTLPGGWQSSQRRDWGSMAVTMLVRAGQVDP